MSLDDFECYHCHKRFVKNEKSHYDSCNDFHVVYGECTEVYAIYGDYRIEFNNKRTIVSDYIFYVLFSINVPLEPTKDNIDRILKMMFLL